MIDWDSLPLMMHQTERFYLAFLEYLKDTEWSGTRASVSGMGTLSNLCPTCGNFQAEGHTPGCSLARLIKETIPLAPDYIIAQNPRYWLPKFKTPTAADSVA